MNIFKHIISVSIFILLIIGNLIAQDTKAKKIESLMTKAHQFGIFNGSVLVVENGNTVYQSEFGYSDVIWKSELTSDYRFNIGSIGKEFNAVGIMMLKEQGKLDLDDKISKFLKDLPKWADKISVRNLLQYTSGLPDINWKTIKNDDDIYRDLKALEKLNSEPGITYAYNNSNVFLQRRIIEKVSGISFAQFVESNMIRPCGMNHSEIDPNLKGKNVAVSFNNDFVQDERQFSYVMSGWTSVTAEDLYKWARCIDDYKLINRNSFKEILIPFLPGKQSSLGGGMFEGDMLKEHMHQGSSFDFEALLYDAPSEKISVILLTNNMNYKLFEIKDSIKSILKGEPYKTPKKSILFLLKKIDNTSVREIIKLYDGIKTNQSEIYDLDSEADYNQIGYALMNKKRLDEAIEIFELNTKAFPLSANAYDSLGEAYFTKGDKKSALLNYKKSLELDPKNAGAKEMIDKLENEKQSK